MKIKEIFEQIKRYGPTRVVISKEGEAVNPKRAREQNIFSNVVFVRNDGWSLGTPDKFMMTALNMWPDEWTHVIIVGDRSFSLMTIDEFFAKAQKFMQHVKDWYTEIAEEERNV